MKPTGLPSSKEKLPTSRKLFGQMRSARKKDSYHSGKFEELKMLITQGFKGKGIAGEEISVQNPVSQEIHVFQETAAYQEDFTGPMPAHNGTDSSGGRGRCQEPQWLPDFRAYSGRPELPLAARIGAAHRGAIPIGAARTATDHLQGAFHGGDRRNYDEIRQGQQQFQRGQQQFHQERHGLLPMPGNYHHQHYGNFRENDYGLPAQPRAHLPPKLTSMNYPKINGGFILENTTNQENPKCSGRVVNCAAVVGMQVNGERVPAASGSRTAFHNNSKSPEHFDMASKRYTFSDHRKAIHDPNSVESITFRLTIPAKSAPPSGFSSPVLSPRRLSNVDVFPSTFNASHGLQTWSAPDVPSMDMVTGMSPQTSPDKLHVSPDISPLYSPAIKSPIPKSKNSSTPQSPLHPKMYSENSSAWHDSNVNLNVHPLPLPPEPDVFTQPSFSHQNAIKNEGSSMTSQWQKQKLIGSGTFGNVYRATNRHTGALCAMKEVNIIPDDPKSAECLKQLEQEIKVLSKLKHPNIVQYYGSELAGDRFFIYLEYVFPGSINKYVQEHCGAMTESIIRNFTRHILNGLSYLHSTNNIHRDIKGANLLVDVNGSVKLADFGMAKHLSGATPALSLKGTPYWMAPEVVQATMDKEYVHKKRLEKTKHEVPKWLGAGSKAGLFTEEKGNVMPPHNSRYMGKYYARWRRKEQVNGAEPAGSAPIIH